MDDSKISSGGESLNQSSLVGGDRKKRHTVVVNPSFIEKLEEKTAPSGKSTRPFWSKKKVTSLDVNKLEIISSRSKSLIPPLQDAQIMETDPDELDLASRIVLLRKKKKQDDAQNESIQEESSYFKPDGDNSDGISLVNNILINNRDASPSRIQRNSSYKIKIHRPVEDFKRAVIFLQHFFRYRFYLRKGKYFMNEILENEEDNNNVSSNELNQASIWGE
jgi:hypothetical protein